MNQVTVQLQGGLGNYLFQIAAVYAYAKRTNKECFFNSKSAVQIHQHIDRYKENILSKVNFETKPLNNAAAIVENGFHYQEFQDIKNRDVTFVGYFQSEKYFSDIKDEIIELFDMPKEFKENFSKKYSDINFSEFSSLHVRRGDYLNLPDHHPTQNMNYYMKAIKEVGKDEKILIFSDDIEWCKNTFPKAENKFFYFQGEKDVEDLYAMSLCKNNIICNSTFSWWSAYLNMHKDKKVIIPSLWFGKALSSFKTDDLYPENWIKI